MRMIRKEVEVDAAPAAVWEAWTTAAGAVTFFAPEARIGGGDALSPPRRSAPATRTSSCSSPQTRRRREGAAATAAVSSPTSPASCSPSTGTRRRAFPASARRRARPGSSSSSGPSPARRAALVALAEGRGAAAEGQGAAGRTLVRLTHLGFGEGDEWDAVFAYFERAWGTVLRRLARRFVSGPIDWEAPDGA